MLTVRTHTAAIALFARSSFIAVLCFALSVPPAFAGEISAPKSAPKDGTSDFLSQIDGLEKTLVEANQVTVSTIQKENSAVLQSAREASQAAIGDKPKEMLQLPEQRVTSAGAWAGVVPTKSDRVGEQATGANSGGNSNPNVNEITNKPSTSTLSLSDMGNAKNVMNTLAGLDSRRGGSDKMPSLTGINGAAAAKTGAKDKKTAEKKKDDSGSQVDPNNTSTMTKFGDTGELTLNNISKNNKLGDRNEDVKDMLEKAIANKDKNKDKEEQKKKEEQAKLEKEVNELVERDPFKFEDYEALRDLYNQKSEDTEQLLAKNPKFNQLKDMILDKFAGRDGSPTKKKQPLIDFLNGDKFQSPIIVADPTAPTHLERPGH